MSGPYNISCRECEFETTIIGESLAREAASDHIEQLNHTVVLYGLLDGVETVLDREHGFTDDAE